MSMQTTTPAGGSFLETSRGTRVATLLFLAFALALTAGQLVVQIVTGYADPQIGALKTGSAILFGGGTIAALGWLAIAKRTHEDMLYAAIVAAVLAFAWSASTVVQALNYAN